MEDHRVRKFAHFLITYSVALKKGEKILIEVHGSELQLTRALIEEAYQAGGKPFLHVIDYKLERALMRGVDTAHMADIASYELDRMKDMDAYIGLRAAENSSEWNDVGDDKIAIYRKHYWGPLHLDERCNHTKWAVLRYPNDAMAQLAKMSTEEFEDYFFDACLFDYGKMGKAMKSLVALMERTDKVRITGPGTNLSFSIKGIPAIALDGHNNIPDGEVYTAPVKDSVNGVVKYNTPVPYEGFVYTDVELEFAKGKIVRASANDSARLNKLLDMDPGARYTGEFAFGVHPKIKHPIADILFDEKIDGSFHLTPGNSYDNASNGNKSAVHIDFTCIQRPEYGGGEIFFDDVPIRKDGRFVIDELKCLNPENLG
jgi:aminopeptidase